jgi:hypothetical protein
LTANVSEMNATATEVDGQVKAYLGAKEGNEKSLGRAELERFPRWFIGNPNSRFLRFAAE